MFICKSKNSYSFMRKILFLFLFLLFAIHINAQPFFDLFSVSHQTCFPLFKAKDGRTELNSAYSAVDLSVPIKLKEDFLVFSPGYENNFISFRDTTNSYSVHGYKLPVAYVHKWKAKQWKSTVLGIARLNTLSKNNWNKNSLQYGGAFVMAYEKKTNLTYKFGVYYNSEFFGPFIIPLLGIDYRPNDRLKIFGILPGSMNLEYKFSKLLRGGFLFRSLTSSYRTESNQFLRVNDNQLKAFFDFYLAKNHVISVEAGHSILREIKPGVRIDGESTYTDIKTSDGLLLKISYAFRLRLDEEGTVKK